MLILDEADRMLDMGFMPDLKRILTLLPKKRQTLLFSATFSDEIKKLAQEFLVNPITVEAERRNTVAAKVTQSVLLVDHDKKFNVLADLIRARDLNQVLVFTRTKLSAAQLARKLERSGISADAIHGDKTQQERIKALDAFKEGKIVALVATDVASRGLDIDQLPLVINYELPTNAEDYVHRIGRTGRAGASGEAISLVDDDEERRLIDIEKLLKHQFPREHAVVTSHPREHSSHDREREPQHREPQNREYQRSERPVTQAKKPPIDDWFLKPYVPTPSTVKPEENPISTPEKPKKQIAALLCRPPEKR
jgi:superfamily II DNA/RNA helicase